MLFRSAPGTFFFGAAAGAEGAGRDVGALGVPAVGRGAPIEGDGEVLPKGLPAVSLI